VACWLPSMHIALFARLVVAVLLLALAGPAAAADQTVRGKTLVVANPGAASSRKVTCVAGESSSAATIVGDPTVAGAVLEVRADGATSSAQRFALPQGTSATGKPYWTGTAATSFTYKDGKGANGPVLSVKLQRTWSGTFTLKVKVSGKHGAVDVVPPNPATGGCVALAIVDGDRYSVAFDGTSKLTKNGAKAFVAKSPATSGVCAAVATTTTTTSSTTTTTVASGCAQAADFLDVSLAPGAGAGYPAPSLSVSCTATEVDVTSNGIPHYTFVSITPNGLSAINQTYRFPLHPAVAASPTSLPLLGTVGVTVDGMQITGPNEAAFPDPYGDPVANGIVDGCSGHTAPGGAYHDHALVQKCLVPSGLVAEPWNLPDPTGTERSPVLGYALDGFPIYGPYECTDASCTTIYETLSGWDDVGYESLDCTSSSQCSSTYTCALAMIDGTKRKACIPKTYAWNANQYSAKGGAYLDQCNGHVGPNGDYHYHATATFPYVLGCYRGSTL
jgi:hypothetical protein